MSIAACISHSGSHSDALADLRKVQSASHWSMRFQSRR